MEGDRFNTMENSKSIVEQWQDGEMSSEVALEMLCHSLDAVQNELAPLQGLEKQTRDQLSQIVERGFEGKAQVQGFGSLKITEPVQLISYDRKELDELVIELVGQGQSELAQRIQSFRRESSRIGSLRIDRIRNNGK